VLYVCIATHNNDTTVGLLLWKLRKVFQDHPREYHILVADDASTDGTRKTLETYQRALPMTLIRHEQTRGRAAALNALFRDALGRSDRHRRDGVVTLPADFSVSPAVLPDLIKRFESGADVVIGEIDLEQEPVSLRLMRKSAPWLLKPGIALPGIRDFLSGISVIRLVTLKNCYRDRPDSLFEMEGLCADAELIARVAANARQVAAVGIPPYRNGGERVHAHPMLTTAIKLFRAGRRLRIPAPQVEIQRS
jgi:glycosyltransferase involved in cell wall biosynthesis